MAQTIGPEGLSPEVLSQLATVLLQLSSADNAVRTAAEAQLNQQLTAQCALLLSALANLTKHHQDQHLRSFAAVLLRRLALKTAAGAPDDASYYVWIGEPTRQYIQTELLSALRDEQASSTRRKVADTIAELGKHMLAKGSTWNELLHAIFECGRSPAADHRVSAFQIVAQVPGLISDTDSNAMKRFLGSGLQDAATEVKLESLHASVAYLLELDGPQTNPFRDFVPEILNVLPALSGEEQDVETALGYLIELADIHPKLLRPLVPQIVQYSTGLMTNDGLELSTRQSALELLMTLSEAAPAMMRKNPQFCQTLVPILLDWMSHLEENEKWFDSEDEEDEDDDGDDIIAGEALDRLARALGGKTVLPVTFTLIPSMLANEDWRKRHAAMMTISAIAEGCAKIMEAELATVLQLLTPHLRDPHARVQWATCNALGQMSSDFAPTMQTKYADVVLTNLIPILDFKDCPRVQAHAAAALVNFCQEVEKDVIAPYLQPIFEKLLILLNTGKIYVQEQAITSIATVADSAGDHFVNYYPAIMPLLLNVLRQATSKEFRLLRGKAIECASLIALAVGKEVFAADAAQFIELLRITQESITDADDPQSSYLLAAWARLCKVMEADFVPYLDFVLPPLLKSAQLKPDFALIDADEDEEALREKYDEDWEMLVVDGQRLCIRTTVLEEKCTAVEMLICYARELGAGFAPHVEKVMSIVVPLLKFYFHEGVRHAAAGVIPLLFTSIIKAQVSPAHFNVPAVWNMVLTSIIECIQDEVDSSFLAQLYTTTQETLEILGPNSTGDDLRSAFVVATTGQLKGYFERTSERNEYRQDADHDAEDEEALQNEEETDDAFLAELASALQQFFIQHREAFLPQFDQLAPYVHTFLTSNQTAMRQWALLVYDDVIEYASPASARYQAQFWEQLAKCVVDPAPEIRQAAAYGVGIAAQVGGPAYVQGVAAAIPSLFAVINAPGSRDEGNVIPTENAISAVGKICHHMGQSGAFDVNQVLSAWVAALPITEDTDEGPATYSYLLELLQQNHPSILGPNNANLPKVGLILAEALAVNDMLGDKPELTVSVVGTLRQLMSNSDASVREQIWNNLTPEKRKVLVNKGYV